MKAVFDSNEEYHAHNSISASGLKKIVELQGSVKEYLAQTYKSKKAFEFGNAIHALLLEGRKKYEEDFYELPELGDMRTKANKDLKAQLMEKANGRSALDYKDVQVIREIERQFYANPLAVESCKGDIELSHYTEFEGVPVRVRPDCLNAKELFISDVKSTRSVFKFKKDVYDYNYHVQAAFYCTILGYPIENFRFVAVKNTMENDNPLHPELMVRVVKLNDQMIERGFELMRWAFDRWKHYVETGEALGIDSLTDENGIEIL